MSEEQMTVEFTPKTMKIETFIVLSVWVILGVIFFACNLIHWGCIFATLFIVSVTWNILTLKRPLKICDMTEAEQGIVKVNDDIYDLNKDDYFFVPDTGLIFALPVFGRCLNVLDKNRKVIARYGIGPGLFRESRILRAKLFLCLEYLTRKRENREAMEQVENEKIDNFGKLVVEFSGKAIREHFYRTGMIPLAFGLAGILISKIPASGYERMTDILFMLSVVLGILGLLLACLFLDAYTKLARRIEIREDIITVNGTEFERRNIRALYVTGTNEALLSGESNTYFIIKTTRGMHRFFIGQAGNKDCYEARKKLINSLSSYYGKGRSEDS